MAAQKLCQNSRVLPICRIEGFLDDFTIDRRVEFSICHSPQHFGTAFSMRMSTSSSIEKDIGINEGSHEPS